MIGFDHLPDELIDATFQNLDFSSLQVVARTSNRFRDAVRLLDLDRESSCTYIANEGGYRDEVNRARSMPHSRTRLNLGEDFKTYMGGRGVPRPCRRFSCEPRAANLE